MISETNPETGTTTYVYDTDSPCGTSKGDLVKKTDAASNVICYTYDARHRMTSAVSTSGPHMSTLNRYFTYDAATVNGATMQNANARLAEAFTSTCKTCAKNTDFGESYNALGQPADVYESTQHSGGYYHLSSLYFANGALNTISGLAGLPTITYNVDGEGRTNTASASSGQNPLTGTSYNNASQPTQLTLGSADIDSYTYDPSTNRMTQYQFSVNGNVLKGVLGWNPNGTLGTLTITDGLYAGSGNESCTYSHDDLERIASANCGSSLSQTFAYDPFGNISKSGSFSFAATYNTATNQMSAIGGYGVPTYDGSGNVTNDFLHTYSWDINNRPVNIDTLTVTYDALGRMVEQYNGSSYTQLVYAPSGSKIALMNGASLQKAYVALPAGAVAEYNSAGLWGYHHADWLGGYSAASSPSRVKLFETAYGPFGEPLPIGGSSTAAFTGMSQDTVSALYDFPAREYGYQGRWPSPDPAGLGSVDVKDPQTWNRYAYVRNSPLSSTDPLGLLRCPTATMGCSLNDDGGDGGCEEDGVDASCGGVNGLLGPGGFPDPGISGNGGVVQCPNNDCGVGSGTPYQCMDQVCGYMSYEYSSSHANEVNGVLLSDPAYALYEALTHLGDMLGQAGRTGVGLLLDFKGAGTSTFSILDLVGGHANFDFECSDWTICGPGRYDNGVHVECLDGSYNCSSGPLMVHDDTASPWLGQAFSWGSIFTTNFWIHAGADYIGGSYLGIIFSQ